METKVRIIKRSTEYVSGCGKVQNLFFQILTPKYSNCKDILDVACTLEFFASETLKEFSLTDIKVNSLESKNFLVAAKVLDKINDNLYYGEKTPEKIFDLLECKEYSYYSGSFLPVNYSGRNRYSIKQFGSKEIYKVIYSINEITANKEAEIYAKNNPSVFRDGYMVELIETSIKLYPVELSSDL